MTKPPRAIDQRMCAASEYGALPVGPSAAPRSEEDRFRFTVTQRVDVGDMHFRVARLTSEKPIGENCAGQSSINMARGMRGPERRRHSSRRSSTG